MAPNFWNSTTNVILQYNYRVSKHGPYDVYYKTSTSYESYNYSGSTTSVEYWSHSDKYDTSYTVSLVYPSREIEINVKKLLKKMADTLCKEGWIHHKPYYLEPVSTSISLRGVRLEGRGWGNKK